MLLLCIPVTILLISIQRKAANAFSPKPETKSQGLFSILKQKRAPGITAEYSFHSFSQYQSCFSPRSKALIATTSSSVSSKPNRSRFSLICSGLEEPGITTMPRCRSHRRITWADDTPWAWSSFFLPGLFLNPAAGHPPYYDFFSVFQS